VDFRIIPLQKPVLGQQSRPFQHKNCQGLDRSLFEAAYVFYSNHADVDPFRHFQCCYSFTALLKEFSWFYDTFLFICTFINNNFFPADFLQPWWAWQQKCRPLSELGLEGVVVFKVVSLAMPSEQPIGGCLFLQRIVIPVVFSFYRTSLACSVFKIFCPAHWFLITPRNSKWPELNIFLNLFQVFWSHKQHLHSKSINIIHHKICAWFWLSIGFQRPIAIIVKTGYDNQFPRELNFWWMMKLSFTWQRWVSVRMGVRVIYET
jgi:hypothetical protein